MNALIWRLHFKQVYFAVAALVVLAVVLLVTGINMANDYHAFFANCAATKSCGDASSVLFRGDGAIIDVVDGTLVVPLLLGLFWGAPMLAKEYEDGTQNLAWTQGVTRRRWLSTNIAVGVRGGRRLGWSHDGPRQLVARAGERARLALRHLRRPGRRADRLRDLRRCARDRRRVGDQAGASRRSRSRSRPSSVYGRRSASTCVRTTWRRS